MENTSVDTSSSTLKPPSTHLEIHHIYDDLFNLVLKPPKVSGPSSQFEDLQESKEQAEAELNEANIALGGYCEKISQSREEFDRLEKQSGDILNHNEILSQKKAELENEVSILQKSKVSSHDIELVRRKKFQYKCLRNMMQVRFKFDKSNEDVLEGYVFNKVTKKVISFSLNIGGLKNDQIQQRLMNLMKDASHKSYATFMD